MLLDSILLGYRPLLDLIIIFEKQFLAVVDFDDSDCVVVNVSQDVD